MNKKMRYWQWIAVRVAITVVGGLGTKLAIALLLLVAQHFGISW